MSSDFPRIYDMVRQGRRQAVSVASLEGLIDLRTELELVRRFTAGVSHELVAVIERRLKRARMQDGLQSPAQAEQVSKLEDMRAILRDGLSPVNADAIARLDGDYPQVKAGLAMQSINKDTQEFREDLVDHLSAEGEDVDALLAALSEATDELEAEAPTAADAMDDSADLDIDGELDALLATTRAAEADEDQDAADPAELEAASESSCSGLEEPTQADATFDAVADPMADAESAEEQPVEFSEPQAEAVPAQELAADEAQAATEEPAEAHQPQDGEVPAAASLDQLSEQMSESLNSAEEGLDAIASAFETAAAELGQVKSEVAEALGSESESFVAGAQNATEQAEAAALSQDAPTIEADLADNQAGRQAGDFPKSAKQMRGQLQQARANILSELDDFLVLLDRVDQMQSQADRAVRKAREFEQAAVRAQHAGEQLAAAESEAAKARQALEEAQSRVSGARRAWEDAHKQASAAAAETLSVG